MPRIPLGFKIAWTAWVALWAAAYGIHHLRDGALWQFLWFCDVANFAITIGLWLESPLILSWQALSVVVVQLLYLVDAGVRLLFGFHPFGGTAFLFDGSTPLHISILSVALHALTPPVLLWSVKRLGYDRRALPVQAIAAALLLVVSFAAGAERNINWSHGPFGGRQSLVPPPVYLAGAALAYTLILYWPTHLFLSKVWPRVPRPAPPS